MYRLNIRKLLDEKGKSQYWLSKQTGISQNNIGKIYNGETVNIRLDTINKLCDALECDPGDLFTTSPIIFEKDDTK